MEYKLQREGNLGNTASKNRGCNMDKGGLKVKMG